MLLDWQQELESAIRDPLALCRELGLPETLAVTGQAANAEYPLLVPRPYLKRIEPGNPDDPLLLQILPQAVETETVEGFSTDPVAEFPSGEADRCSGRLLRKYANRSLLLASEQCGVHCRYCFRRHYKSEKSGEPFDLESVDSPELILSGGDPLMLADSELQSLLYQAAAAPRIRRVRIHSRLPVVIPSRLSEPLLEMLKPRTGLVCYLVLHINHPREIDAEFAAAIGRTIDRGIPVLAQSVLLRKVNDDPRTLEELYETLISLRIIPYYLHQLDRVAGAAHFEVPVERGKSLMQELRRALPGYAVPKYVREESGRPHKIEIY